MTTLPLFFLSLIIANLVAAPEEPSSEEILHPVVALRVTLSKWKKVGGFLSWKKFDKKEMSTQILTFDRTVKVCPLKRTDGVWQCSTTSSGDACEKKGLALVYAKGKRNQKVGRFTTYRFPRTKPTKNVEMIFCAGPGVTMTHKPMLSTYFWSMDANDPAAMKIESKDFIPIDLPDAYILSYGTDKMTMVDMQWTDEAKKLVTKSVRILKIPIVFEESQDTTWQIPVRIEDREYYNYYYSVTPDCVKQHLVPPVQPGGEAWVSIDYRLLLVCEANGHPTGYVEGVPQSDLARGSFIVAGNGAKLSKVSETQFKFTFTTDRGISSILTLPSPGKDIECLVPFPGGNSDG